MNPIDERVSPPVHLYQVVYSPETLAAADPGHPVLDNLSNERPDWREYWPIRRFLLENALDEDAFYGFFSPKFPAKTAIDLNQAAAFVRLHAPRVDVVLFSPQPDMAAFFLNVFEQGEVFDPGLIEVYEEFLRLINRPISLGGLVMDSSQIVFSNYFAARPAFWRAWLMLNEALFAFCENSDSKLRQALCQPTTYPVDVQRKVFLVERAASLLLVTERQWRSKAYNPFGMGWSMSRFREHPTEAVISDALKIALRKQGFAQYLEAFVTVRERFRASGSSDLPSVRTTAGKINEGAAEIEQSIDTLHRSKVGKISDKWASYLDYYDTIFGPLRNSPVSVLEIGVQNGGSLETWAAYFRAGRNFLGCDINFKCEQLRYDDPRISIVVGDANAPKTLEAIRTLCSDIDIIIDDGSHLAADILNCFLNYFPFLKPGGLYIVEDTHALYCQHGGELLNASGVYSFFKQLVEVTNFQFWNNQISIDTYFRTFFPSQSTPSFILDGWVDSIEFRNSMITIRKASQVGHEKLGEHIIAGDLAQVQVLPRP